MNILTKEGRVIIFGQKIKLVPVIALLFFCVSCTTIEVTDMSGNVEIERHFGFSSISTGDNSGSVSAKITSLGYVSTPLGINFGYSSQSVLISDSDCRIVVWLDQSLDEAVLNELETISSVCFSQ